MTNRVFSGNQSSESVRKAAKKEIILKKDGSQEMGELMPHLIKDSKWAHI